VLWRCNRLATSMIDEWLWAARDVEPLALR
jgi:hypothetical protein